MKVIIQSGDETFSETILANFESLPLGQAKFEALQPLAEFLSRVKSTTSFKRGVDGMIAFQAAIPQAYQEQVAPLFSGMLSSIQKTKLAAGLKEHADYIETKLKDKKGF